MHVLAACVVTTFAAGAAATRINSMHSFKVVYSVGSFPGEGARLISSELNGVRLTQQCIAEQTMSILAAYYNAGLHTKVSHGWYTHIGKASFSPNQSHALLVQPSSVIVTSSRHCMYAFISTIMCADTYK